MAGNEQSGATLKKTMIKKFGSEEAWKEFMRTNGSKGGKNGTGHKYGHGKVSPSENGKLGGIHSKRGYKFICENDEYSEYIDKKTNEKVKFYK